MTATYHRLTTPSSTTHTPHTRPHTVLSSSYYYYNNHYYYVKHTQLPVFPPFPPAPVCVYKSPCHVLFDPPLMKALDWAETFGNFVTIDICPSIYWLVKFSIPNHVIWLVGWSVGCVVAWLGLGLGLGLTQPTLDPTCTNTTPKKSTLLQRPARHQQYLLQQIHLTDT